MARSLEYLDAALEDAASAAEWYLQRSAAAAEGFAEEIDAAVAAIERLPKRGLPTNRALIDTSSGDTRSASFIDSSRRAS